MLGNQLIRTLQKNALRTSKVCRNPSLQRLGPRTSALASFSRLDQKTMLLRQFCKNTSDEDRPFTEKEKAENDEFIRMFREGTDAPKSETNLSFTNYEVYFLKKDIDLLRRHLRISFYMGLGLFSTSIPLAYFSYKFGALMMAFLGVVPFVRGAMASKSSSKLVSSVWLSPDKQNVCVIAGLGVKKIKAKISNIQPVTTRNLTNMPGFQLFFDITDDMDFKHENLMIFIEPKACDVENIDLLSAMLSGKVEEVSQFEFKGDPSQKKMPS